MKKYNMIMQSEEYFAIKNFLVELRQQGKFDNDVYMMKFYKAFAINSSIKLEIFSSSFFNETIVFSMPLPNFSLSLIIAYSFLYSYSNN